MKRVRPRRKGGNWTKTCSRSADRSLDPIMRQDGNAFEEAGALLLEVDVALLLHLLEEAELVVDRAAAVEAPVHVREIKFQRRVAGVGGDQAAVVYEARQCFHGATSSHRF